MESFHGNILLESYFWWKIIQLSFVVHYGVHFVLLNDLRDYKVYGV